MEIIVRGSPELTTFVMAGFKIVRQNYIKYKIKTAAFVLATKDLNELWAYQVQKLHELFVEIFDRQSSASW